MSAIPEEFIIRGEVLDPFFEAAGLKPSDVESFSVEYVPPFDFRATFRVLVSDPITGRKRVDGSGDVERRTTHRVIRWGSR